MSRTVPITALFIFMEKIFLFRPLRTNFLSQKFGENNACRNPFTKQVLTKTGSTCPIGFEDFYKSINMKGHNGEDWACWRGEPIYHSGNYEGWAKTEVDRDGGIGIDINSAEKIEVLDSHVKLRYWHLLKVNVFDGQEIKPGDLIGWGDSTGASSGNHLHWSLKPCNHQGVPTYPNNGFTGAIDHSKYYDNTFILDFLNIKQQLNLYQQVVKLLHQLLKGR